MANRVCNIQEMENVSMIERTADSPLIEIFEAQEAINDATVEAAIDRRRKNGNDGTLVVAISGSSSSIQNSSGAGSHDAPLHFLQYEKDFTAQQITLEDGSTAYLSILSLDATACAGNQTIVEPFEIDNDAFLSVAPLGGGSLLAAESISSETSRSSKHGSKRAAARPSKFICEFAECAKDFATAHALKVHRRSHTGERPFSCPSEGCNKSFKTSGDLQKHVRTHTGERPFRCPYEGCNKSFSTANIRKVHIRTHTGERPYKCDDCDKSFSNMTNYKNHRRTHTGEKPFTCNVCGRPFAEYSSLYKHKVTHNDGKPYACDLCGRSYRQVSSLSNHRRVCPFANVRLTEAGSNAEDMLAWKLNSNGELVQELLSTVDGQAVAIVCLDDGSDRSGTILIRPTEEEDEEEEEEDDEDAKSDQVIDAQVLTSSEH